MTSYAMSGWTYGQGSFFCAGSGITYSPINILSSGSRWNTSGKRITLSNLSMSAWYGYDHTLYIPTGVTGTLYPHADAAAICYPTTMLPIEVGTSNATYSINISGSSDYNESLVIFYGKPWYVNGSTAGAPPATILVNAGTGNINTTYNINYTYNSASGSRLYCVLLSACP
jgi:hypothetical protein